MAVAAPKRLNSVGYEFEPEEPIGKLQYYDKGGFSLRARERTRDESAPG
jgi:hypothetical protein